MPPYEIVLKAVPAQRVAAIRDTIPTYNQQQELWNELEGYLARNRAQYTGPCFTLYHDDEYRERDVDAEVCQPVDASVGGGERIKVYDLPGCETMASVVHHGPFNTLTQAYNAIMEWSQSNGYRIVGADREIYLKVGDGEVRQDDPSYVTEIQIPVEKV